MSRAFDRGVPKNPANALLGSGKDYGKDDKVKPGGAGHRPDTLSEWTPASRRENGTRMLRKDTESRGKMTAARVCHGGPVRAGPRDPGVPRAEFLRGRAI